jgi:hypothetical protein
VAGIRAVDWERFAAPLVGAVAFVLYALTAYPTVAGGDSGELTAAVATGGVIHPPGYPLYSLLGRLFVILPITSGVAGRLNLMSAVLDAAAAGFVFAAVERRCRSGMAALAAAFTFAFAPAVWKYALCAEVFALNDLLVAVLLWLATRYDEDGRRVWALSGAFVCGLGLSNHHTFVLVAVPVMAWALWRGRCDRFTIRFAGQLAGAFALGLLPYAYLPLAASSASPVSWGATGTWSGFWTHVSRREYGTLHLSVPGVADAGSPTATLGAWADSALAQFGPVASALPLLGAVAAVRQHVRAGLGVVLLAGLAASVGVIVVLGNLPVTDALHREIVARFWQQPAVLASVLCGEGVVALECRLPRKFVRAAVAVVLVAPLPSRFASVDRHASTLVRSYGVEILRTAPPGALLVTKGDLITNTVRYLQAVEGQRPDVRVVDQELLGYAWSRPRIEHAHPEIVIPGVRYMPGASDGFVIKEFFDANYDRAPIVVCGGIKPGDTSADRTYGRWPLGLCERVRRGDEPVDVDAWIKESERALPVIDFGGQAHPAGSWEGVVWSDYWEVRQARAAHLLAIAGADPERRRFIGVAVGILEGIVDRYPDAPPHVYRNLAMALGRQGFETDDQRARAARAWRRYLDTGPRDDPQRVAIEREVARLKSRIDDSQIPDAGR